MHSFKKPNPISCLHILLTCSLSITVVMAYVITDKKVDYPNPDTDPQLCNTRRGSFVCNPDGVISQYEVDRLDRLALNMSRSRMCVCSKSCGSGKRGLYIGFYIMQKLPENSSEDLAKIAHQLRLEWKLGTCQDDIIIVIEAETKQATFDMGKAVEKVINKTAAETILNRYVSRLKNKSFYKALESVVNSYEDMLLNRQKTKNNKPKIANDGYVVGMTLGSFALFAFVLYSAKTVHKNWKKSQRHLKRNANSEDGDISISTFNTGDSVESCGDSTCTTCASNK